MSRKSIIGGASIGAVAVSVAGVWLMAGLESAQAEGTPPVGMLHSSAVQALALGEAEYIGSKKCKMCHIKQFKSWSKTKMGTAFDILKPNERAEAKVKAKLDPAKDYTRDEKCLKCHTVGFGHTGGFTLPAEGDAKAMAKAVKALGNVGCESCHGPGSEYKEFHMKVMKEKKAYTTKDMKDAGMTSVTKATCTACHNDQSPTYDTSKPFDYETLKDQGVHEHYELKYRKDEPA